MLRCPSWQRRGTATFWASLLVRDGGRLTLAATAAAKRAVAALTWQLGRLHPARCDGQCDVADRQHPHGRRGAGTSPPGREGRRWWWADAQLHPQGPWNLGPLRRPPRQRPFSDGARARCSSPPGRRWPSSTGLACSRWSAPTTSCPSKAVLHAVLPACLRQGRGGPDHRWWRQPPLPVRSSTSPPLRSREQMRLERRLSDRARSSTNANRGSRRYAALELRSLACHRVEHGERLRCGRHRTSARSSTRAAPSTRWWWALAEPGTSGSSSAARWGESLLAGHDGLVERLHADAAWSRGHGELRGRAGDDQSGS